MSNKTDYKYSKYIQMNDGKTYSEGRAQGEVQKNWKLQLSSYVSCVSEN